MMSEIFRKDEVLELQLCLTICIGLPMAMGVFKREVNFASTQISLFYVLACWIFADNRPKSGLCLTDTEMNLPPQNNVHA
jgi:hypothetical protein